MAVEEVRVSSFHYEFFSCQSTIQEFSIEIPDAEADEIQTVAQGTAITLPTEFPIKPLYV